jgi:hypothetical protein
MNQGAGGVIDAVEAILADDNGQNEESEQSEHPASE